MYRSISSHLSLPALRYICQVCCKSQKSWGAAQHLRKTPFSRSYKFQICFTDSVNIDIIMSLISKILLRILEGFARCPRSSHELQCTLHLARPRSFASPARTHATHDTKTKTKRSRSPGSGLPPGFPLTSDHLPSPATTHKCCDRY